MTGRNVTRLNGCNLSCGFRLNLHVSKDHPDSLLNQGASVIV